MINAGRMAVVLEIEVSEPFGCRGWDAPTCDRAKVDRELDDLYRRGVRSALLLNKFDNPLSGVRFDSGNVGTIINAGNVASAGSFWSARTCTGPLRDNTIATAAPAAAAGVAGLLQGTGVVIPPAPLYPPAPHCNTRGLTDLGRHVVGGLMDRRMIVNPDHMSQAGVAATLSLLEARGYSGVISPHGWMDPGNWPRLWKLGGLAFPGHSNADQYVREWTSLRPRSTPYTFGWGYGADLGGLSVQPGAGALTYPFKSLDGTVTFERQKTGERTFDYAREGVAHYGLYADWFADLRRLGGDAIGRGPVGWRRGVPGDVGARRRRRVAGVRERCAHEPPAPRGDLDRGAAPRRAAATARSGLELVRAGGGERERRRRGGLRTRRARRAGREHGGRALCRRCRGGRGDVGRAGRASAGAVGACGARRARASRSR